MVFVMSVTSQAFAFGYIAPEEVEQEVAECSGKNLNTLKCARGIERKVLAKSNGTVKRVDGSLQIRITKKLVLLDDKPEESGDNAIAYSYLGFSKRLNSHILHVQYYEGGAYMVIHHLSGQHAFPSGYPIASPDGKTFLSLSEDMFAGYNPNNIEIWRIPSNKFSRVANFEPEWGPRNGSWLNLRSARIDKRCHDNSENNFIGLKDCGVAIIEFSDSKWKLIE